jgi:hypothetical protein
MSSIKITQNTVKKHAVIDLRTVTYNVIEGLSNWHKHTILNDVMSVMKMSPDN